MDKVVSHLPLTLDIWVQSQASPGRICGGQSGTGKFFSWVLCFSVTSASTFIHLFLTVGFSFNMWVLNYKLWILFSCLDCLVSVKGECVRGVLADTVLSSTLDFVSVFCISLTLYFFYHNPHYVWSLCSCIVISNSVFTREFISYPEIDCSYTCKKACTYSFSFIVIVEPVKNLSTP
jgi:hypothetical protein